MRFMMVLAASAVLASPVAAQDIAPVTIHFQTNTDSLTSVGRVRLDRVPPLVRAAPDAVEITVMGHADPTEGSPAETVGLSQRRANTVRDYLIARGVRAEAIVTRAFGATRPAIESSEHEWENGRVEVTFGPGSGW